MPPRSPKKGRKFWLTAWVLGIPFVSCTVALYLGRLSGAEYVGFLQWTIPLGISAHHAANVAQKAFSKEAANAGEDPRGA